jgi:hypothetical protein
MTLKIVEQGGARVLALALALTACSGEGVETPETIGSQNFAINEVEFNQNMPSTVVLQGIAINTSMRRGFSANSISPNAITTYERPQGRAWKVIQWPGASQYRPFRWWEATKGHWSTLYVDAATNLVQDTEFGPLFAQFQGASGPPVGLRGRDGMDCAFQRFTLGAQIMQSCLLSNSWENWGHDSDPTLPPTTGPLAFRRSTNSDSVIFGCGTGGTQFCEFRLSTQDKTFTSDFGGGSYYPGTRPTGIANLGNGERWVFAVTQNGSTRSVLAKQETSAIDSMTVTYTTPATLASTSSDVAFSTPMPYFRSDGKLAVVFLYTDRSTSSSTRVKEVVWSGSAWSSMNELHDVGRDIVTNYPAVDVEVFVAETHSNTAYARNTVLFRTPLSSTAVKDTVELAQQPDGYYLKTLLPSADNEAGLYAMSTTGVLNALKNGTSLPVALGNPLPAPAVAFTTDQVGLAYAIADSKLWEIGLTDGVARRIGTDTWSSCSNLVHGYVWDTVHNYNIPTLWGLCNQFILKVNLGSGTREVIGSQVWGGTTSMMYAEYTGVPTNEHLFVQKTNTGLYRVNKVTGEYTKINSQTTGSSIAKWGSSIAIITTNISDRTLYTANPATGVFASTGLVFTQQSKMTEHNGYLYVAGYDNVAAAWKLKKVSTSNVVSTVSTHPDWATVAFLRTRLWQLGG